MNNDQTDWLVRDYEEENKAWKALQADIQERGEKPKLLEASYLDDHLSWWSKRDALIRAWEYWRDLLVYHARLVAMERKLHSEQANDEQGYSSDEAEFDNMFIDDDDVGDEEDS